MSFDLSESFTRANPRLDGLVHPTGVLAPDVCTNWLAWIERRYAAAGVVAPNGADFSVHSSSLQFVAKGVKGSGMNIDIFSPSCQTPSVCRESYDWNMPARFIT